MVKTPSDTKQKLLRAAAQVVQEKGVSKLTIDAVAEAAQISKGGLLYHFPTKIELLKAMAQQLIDAFEQAIAAQLSDGDLTWLEAYVGMSFDPNHSQVAESAGLLAAVSNEPSLLEPLRSQYLQWQAAVEESGLDPAIANIVRLAADGLWYTELFNVSPLTAEQRSQAKDALMQLIQDHKALAQ